MTLLAIILAAVVGYLLGSARGFAAGVRLMTTFSEPNPFVEAQRDRAPFQ